MQCDKALILEQCGDSTGGWIAKCCTDLPGSSHWFERSFVTYTNEAKMEELGVLVETLQAYGALSEATASEMATGALRQSCAHVSVSVCAGDPATAVCGRPGTGTSPGGGRGVARDDQYCQQ